MTKGATKDSLMSSNQLTFGVTRQHHLCVETHPHLHSGRRAGTRGCSVMLVWGAVCGEGMPHGLGSVWGWSPILAPPDSPPPAPCTPHCHTHHMVHAPMMDPSSFHLLRLHTSLPSPHPLPPSLLLCLPYSCISLGPTSSRKPSLIFQATSSQPFTVLWDSLHVCLPQQMGASQGGSWGLFTSVSPIPSMASWIPRATQCSSQATSLQSLVDQ